MTEYPSGVPLYFKMSAENSGGARSSVYCSLPTYDTSLPTGRIALEFKSTSSPTTLKISAFIHDDSVITDSLIGAGFGKGSYGDQLSSWKSVNLKARQSDARGKWLFFSNLKWAVHGL